MGNLNEHSEDMLERFKLILKIIGNKKLQCYEIVEKSKLNKNRVSNALLTLKLKGVLNHNPHTGEWWVNKRGIRKYRNSLS